MSLKDYINSDPVDRAHSRAADLEDQVEDLENEVEQLKARIDSLEKKLKQKADQ